MLQLVRPHEFLICKALLDSIDNVTSIEDIVRNEVEDYDNKEFNHALEYLEKSHSIVMEGDTIILNCEITNEFKEYLSDLIEYGLTQYKANYSGVSDLFLLWNDYSKSQVQLKRCVNPGDINPGTFYGTEGDVYIFASIKKDIAEGMEHLNYKDMFLEPSLFQWECKANISDRDLNLLNESKYAHLFIRKVESENGITLPFTYVGRGHLDNPRKTQNKENKRTFIFDIHMDNELPDYLQYDFGLSN